MRGSDIVVLLAVVIAMGAAVWLFAPGGDGDGLPRAKTWVRSKNRMQTAAIKVECMNNLRNIIGLIEVSRNDHYPKYAGANLVLFLVARGEIEGEDMLRILFCPGDEDESFEVAGGVDAYRSIDLGKRGEYGHLTSYAGRDQQDPKCAASKRSGKMVVLVCDDSENHHDGLGFVVGFTGGAVKWRDKSDDWNIDPDAPVTLGKGSVVKELACLVAD